MASDRRLGWGLAALGMLLVSTDSVFVRLAETSAWNVAFLVALCSMPIQLVLNRLFGRSAPMAAVRDNWQAMAGVAVLAGISQTTFIVALTKTDIANVVVIVASAPLMAALAGWALLRERPSRPIWIGIFLTMFGIAIVVSGSFGGPNLGGDLFAVVAIAAFAMSLLIWRRYPELNRFVALALSAAITLLIAAPFASPFGLDSRAYLATAAMGLIFNPLGRVAHSNAPRFAPAAEVALFTPVETVAATIWAWLFFSEVPAATTFVGGAIVIGGVVFGTVASSRSRPATPVSHST